MYIWYTILLFPALKKKNSSSATFAQAIRKSIRRIFTKHSVHCKTEWQTYLQFRYINIDVIIPRPFSGEFGVSRVLYQSETRDYIKYKAIIIEIANGHEKSKTYTNVTRLSILFCIHHVAIIPNFIFFYSAGLYIAT